MKRIVIVGTSGSGKTTLARKLSKIISMPAYDLDDFYWLPNWQEHSLADFRKTVHALVVQPKWIICGNYAAVREMIWREADTIIWLNYSFSRCFMQALKRAYSRIINRQSCCNGNHESLQRVFFSKDSILLWIIKSHLRHQKTYKRLFAEKIAEKNYLRFSKPSETRAYCDLVSIKNLNHDR